MNFCDANEHLCHKRLQVTSPAVIIELLTSPILSRRVSSDLGNWNHIKLSKAHRNAVSNILNLLYNFALDCLNERMARWQNWVMKPDGHFSSADDRLVSCVVLRSTRLVCTSPENHETRHVFDHCFICMIIVYCLKQKSIPKF